MLNGTAEEHGLGRAIVRALHLDLLLLGGVALLLAMGFVVLYSASGEDLDTLYRQGVRVGIAFTVLMVMAQIPANHLRQWSPWVYAGGVLLLLAVMFFGEVGKGAQRWLDLGVVRFQPSEFMKIAVPMMVAWYFADRPLPPRFLEVAAAALLVMVPAVLIAKQPDLGTALLVAGSGLVIIFLAGVRWRILMGLGALALVAAPLLWHFMQDYQRRRVLTLLNPESDPLGAGYHIIQSKIAIGSGGFYGKGWLNGTQSQLEFLPERSTDFIFAVYAEEFGLMGILLLLSLYLLVILRGLTIALRAQDTYSRLLAGSLSFTFFVYVFVNTGMVSGLLPVVGVPLPLFSYGGTSMVTLMAAFGILMSINSHRRLLAR
ncbi:rod shape-determining protein RodA [Ectothiorhodospira shaposhnikovii]|uniref:rod shape-determining protein RodA n=1 Tax=Ectothiorhodospira shaposhnikovii TaxID=1054 RepID=UPI001EE7F8CE|nr:rod shape-determining protein RodA [Ectothiorhodospira shaposhnikovii]MCG5511637.1 rod shape-determining protein RodA [Ectothiorhodospira shaposhnikovii]